MSWKVAALLLLATNCVWAIATKVVATRLPPATAGLLAVGGGFATLAILAGRSAWPANWGRWHVAALAIGLLGGAATWLYYKAISEGPLSVILPLTSQFVVVAAVAGWLIFGEPMNLRTVLGIIFGILSVVLLAR